MVRTSRYHDQHLDQSAMGTERSCSPGPAGWAVVVQTRRGALVQDRWPDLVAAAETQLPGSLVLDGEPMV
ncbi:hypothetical protein ABZW02_21370 [Streptomyces sp. NPDC005180]|uniref:hypothetical protein n=1 Tax=Streptomyces sp. NPDC005180 TaxID=3156868 RepID=UPI0033B6BCEA